MRDHVIVFEAGREKSEDLGGRCARLWDGDNYSAAIFHGSDGERWLIFVRALPPTPSDAEIIAFPRPRPRGNHVPSTGEQQ